jgi:xanthine dehydrogenase accessory factor
LALGPELSQCCGGAVTLAFEPFAPADLAWLDKLLHAAADPVPVIRTLQLDEAGNLRRDWSSETAGEDTEFAATFAAGRLAIRERVNPPAQAVWLFGAGHVGHAVAAALHPLGFALTWIDGRAGQFPEPPPPGVKTLALAMPELVVDEAPPGAVFLVMTHSHPLDEAICEAVLRREDFAHLGLIGSATKRARFVKRLAAVGIAKPQLDRLVCPIGLADIRSKEPTAIAASIAADLLIRRERDFAPARTEARHGG